MQSDERIMLLSEMIHGVDGNLSMPCTVRKVNVLEKLDNEQVHVCDGTSREM